MERKSSSKRLGDMNKEDQKIAIEILEASSQVLAASILAGIKPGAICSIAVLLMEYALIHSNFDKEEAIRVVEEAADHIKHSIETQEAALSKDVVIKRMTQLTAEKTEDENDGNYTH